MDASFTEGPDSGGGPTSGDGLSNGDGTACSQCGRSIRTDQGACLQSQTDSECICEDCYREMLVPGSGDAHGNMS
ncbi:MAG: hypothetical protein P8010_02050 [Desulfosarcinaceae bacterium]